MLTQHFQTKQNSSIGSMWNPGGPFTKPLALRPRWPSNDSKRDPTAPLQPRVLGVNIIPVLPLGMGHSPES